MTFRSKRVGIPHGRKSSLIAALWGVFLLCVPVDAVEVLLPKDRVVVSSDKLLVLAKGSGEDRVAVRLEAGDAVREGQAKAKEGGIFRFQLPLSPGRNVLHVGNERREVFLATDNARAPDGFRPQVIHAGDIGECEMCHEAGWKLRNDGYPDVCLECHEIETHNPKYTGSFRDERHFRASGAACGKCHDPHGERNAPLLVATPADLCGRCHGSWSGTEERHAAFDEGSCTACHDPHFSGYPNELHQEVPGLCEDCHEESEHGPEAHQDELTACATCHDPHEKAGTGLLRGEVAELCGECHDGIAEGETVHPALDEGCNACHQPHRDDDRVQARLTCGECHDLEGDDGVISRHGGLAIPVSLCTACHQPHATRTSHLLLGSMHDPVAERDCGACHEERNEQTGKIGKVVEPCSSCHDIEEDITGKGGELHSPVADGDCTACHDPHMSENRPLLLTPQPEVCADCHDLPDPGGDAQVHAATETCSDCHDPHGGTAAAFLRSPAPALCLECHDDPEETGGEVHPALDEGCLSCHDPHSGTAPGILAQAQRDLCLECHDDPAENQAHKHGAVEKVCSGCHEPHASAREHFLRGDLSDLCQRCHAEGKAPEDGILHEPASDCSECHEMVSHGSAFARHLPQQAPDLCLECHDDPRESEAELHPALDEGCVVCHDPHRGAAPGMMRGESASAPCLECHDDPLAGKDARHGALEEGCQPCHEPHAGANDHFLVRIGNTLCLGCHDLSAHPHTVDAERGAELYPLSTSFPSENGQYRCGGCHEPQASGNTHLFIDRENLCSSDCHKRL